MTTNHHTAIPFRMPLSSANLEAPLGQLDAAIASVIATGSGVSTTLTAQATAASVGPFSVASSAGLLPGDVVFFGDAGGTHESRVVNTVPGGGLTFTVTVALTNTYAIGKPVSKSPVELVDARGSYTSLGGRIGDVEGRVFDAKRYGAKGDGVTNDRSAIQAAADAAFAAGGGTVWLGSGNFVLTGGGITLPSNVTIAGTGRGTVVTVNGNWPAFVSTTTTGSGVRDLRIVGSANAANTANHGVHFSTSATRGRISNVYTDGCFKGIWLFNLCSYITVEDCVIENDTSTLGAIDIGTCEKVSVTNCTVINFAKFGIDVREAGAGSLGYHRIVNCHIQGGETGIVVSGSSSAGVTIPGIAVLGNTCVGQSAIGIIVENGAQFCRINDNLVRDCGSDGILLGQGTGDAPSGNVIENNIVRNAGGHGIFSFQAVHTIVKGNRVSAFIGDGIRVSGGALGGQVIADNIISGGADAATMAAIRLYSAAHGSAVTGNVVRSTNGFGILVEGSERCAITGNAVQDADASGVLTIGGIRVDGTSHRCTISGNSSTRSSGTKQDHGVQVVTGCLNTMIIGNSLFQNTTSAILDNGTGTVSVNNITA